MTVQSADTVLMIRQLHFGFNHETESSNAFQSSSEILDVSTKSVQEFQEVVRRLRDEGDSEAGNFLLLLEGTRSGVNKRPEVSRKLAEYFPEYKDTRKQSPKDVYAGMVQSAFDRMT